MISLDRRHSLFRGLRLSATLAGLSCALGAPSGCLDLTPLQADTSGVSGAGGAKNPRDASSGEGAVSTERPCRACYLRVAACVDAEALCERTPRCGQFIQCMLDKGCFEGGPDTAANLCAIPCALQAGITNPADDAVTNATTLTNCSQVNCPGICFSADAG